MASASHPFYTLVLLLTICHHGLGCKDEPVTDDIAGSTVHIEVLPESINELITDEISMTCTPKDLPQGTTAILFMELGKEGEHPLVSMTGSTLELGSDMKTNMQAKGHNAENASESFLQLTIQRPFVDDVSVYCCRVFYKDEFGELKMGHVYADVSIENNDKAVLIHLLKKVSDLENHTDELEKTNKEQEKQLMDQQKQLMDQQNQLMDQEKELMDQETQVSSSIDQLKEEGMNRSLMIEDIVDRDSFSSAFSVYGTKSSSFSKGETLVFKQSLLNVGNHYNMATGVFTAPRKGLYVFHLFLLTYTDNRVIVHLKVNDVIMASLFADDQNYYDHSSVSTVLSLNTGDDVLPYVHTGNKLAQTNEHYTVYNGYLLKLL